MAKTVERTIVNVKDVFKPGSMYSEQDDAAVAGAAAVSSPSKNYKTLSDEFTAKMDLDAEVVEESIVARRVERSGNSWYEVRVDEKVKFQRPLNLVAVKPEAVAPSTVTPAVVPVATPVRTPVETPVRTPVGTPVRTPVGTPVKTPVRTPARTPVTTPVTTPVNPQQSADPLNTQTYQITKTKPLYQKARAPAPPTQSQYQPVQSAPAYQSAAGGYAPKKKRAPPPPPLNISQLPSTSPGPPQSAPAYVSNTPVPVQYPVEDFGQYLLDDDAQSARSGYSRGTAASSAAKARQRKAAEAQSQQHAAMPASKNSSARKRSLSGNALEQQNYKYSKELKKSYSQQDGTKSLTASLREKFFKFIGVEDKKTTNTRQRPSTVHGHGPSPMRNGVPGGQPVRNLHNFSYADSKIFNRNEFDTDSTILSNGEPISGTWLDNTRSDSMVEMRANDYMPRQHEVRTSMPEMRNNSVSELSQNRTQTWWDMNTMSAVASATSNDVMFKKPDRTLPHSQSQNPHQGGALRIYKKQAPLTPGLSTSPTTENIIMNHPSGLPRNSNLIPAQAPTNYIPAVRHETAVTTRQTANEMDFSTDL